MKNRNMVDITKYSDEQLKEIIIRGLEENGVYELQGFTQEEIADKFLGYTDLGRKLMLEYYSPLRSTQSARNFIMKEGFEHKRFYIGGTHALVAVMLLGHRVYDDRTANINKRDMDNIQALSLDVDYPNGMDFFEYYGLETEDIHKHWRS